ncbi:MAG TPA: glycosyltransferase family 2 protein [Saprospiraceae bacterium]|jgi:glycosyltransferase involved in cell wall biosynthesis|nr:glycosyltransferase [Saprospiraceae bacterium]MCC6689361.1 glycosyltransferase [Saprospiraceae bacterium]HMV24504.1 glycosyltransferase family 2 protein [Saprospiraceae bacterium]HMW74885.1 glycosyltransferase family 2 protein [Saprospiraceae bacterium]HMX83752.1 glycosyltransferase family 2 protein [Saprospiraceae bacterium]
MKLSIITSCYNSAATIRDTLESVARQDYSDIEHIIVDGGSEDDTLAIVSEFTHVAKVVSEKDRGIYDAMNKGIAIATGDIIGILNSDDFYTGPGVISDVVRQMEQSGADTLYADLDYVSSTDKTKVVRSWRAGSYAVRKFYYGWMPPHPTFFVRKYIYERYGTFNLSLRSAADYEIMLRFLVRQDVTTTYLNKTIVQMRAGGQSNASITNRLRANAEDRKAWQINKLRPYLFTTFLKPVRKIHQFFMRGK